MRMRIDVQENNALTHWTGRRRPDYALRMTILAENIAELLRLAKRQQDVADAVGLTQSSVSRLAKGAEPKPESLIAIARYAGVSVETLVEVPIGDWPRQDREAFKHSRQKLGWSLAILAQETHAIIRRERAKASVSADAIEAYEAGTNDNAPGWLAYARMAFEEGGSAKNQVTAPRDDLVYVRQVDIRYAMGDGTAIEDYPETSLVPFNNGFLQGITRAPLEKLILASGHGDSMDPTIKEHDYVLIDATENRLGIGDTVYAFEYAGAGYIKRLRPVIVDGVRMIEVNSDNRAVAPTFTALPEDIHLVGKVVLLMRKRL
jgi:phage repressor protein C with HTH and peptisase S24 domain/predicted XRE-type DNA-binding protein